MITTLPLALPARLSAGQASNEEAAPAAPTIRTNFLRVILVMTVLSRFLFPEMI